MIQRRCQFGRMYRRISSSWPYGLNYSYFSMFYKSYPSEIISKSFWFKNE